MRCFLCGTEKDPSILETFPYEEGSLTQEEPIDPLLVIECETNSVWRAAVVCHHCFHRLDPDMWVLGKHWDSMDPKVPFRLLPATHGSEPYNLDHYLGTVVP